MVNTIDYGGHPSIIVIGAFLDGYIKLDAKTRPPPARAPASITRAASGRATTTPTSRRP